MEPDNISLLLFLIYILTTTVLSVCFFVILVRVRRLRKEYGPVIRIDEKAAEIKQRSISELKRLLDIHSKKSEELHHLEESLSCLNQEIANREELLRVLGDEEEIVLSGYKKPDFVLEDHAAYVVAIKQLREQQKDMIRTKSAVVCPIEWTVGDSKREGQKMVNRVIRLTLRAFNNECDLLIKNVTWKNAQRTRERIGKLAEVLNDLNESTHITVTPGYVELKMKEVLLVEQEKLKREEEKQRLKEQREQEREEAKAQREYLAEIKRQESLEKDKMLALKAARDRLAIASDEHRLALEKEISEIENQLSEAIRNKGRLLSMAEQTRIGHIYIISNEGSFGEGVLKIGMTRRLEPMDRVKELGDASVPFPFEIHALLFSEDAPNFEKRLHSKFEQYRVNKVNNRKEFFRVAPEIVKNVIEAEMPDIPFETKVYSQEYIQSIN